MKWIIPILLIFCLSFISAIPNDGSTSIDFKYPTPTNATYYNNTYINQTVNVTANTTQFDSVNPLHIKESWLTNFIQNIVEGYNYITGADVPNYETDPTIPSTPENPTQKFLNGNKEWSAIAIGGGSYASNIYFTAANSTIVAGYKNLSYVPEPNETINSNTFTSGEYLLRTYIYYQPIGIDTIDSGVWIFNYRAKVSNANTGATYIKVQPFIRLTNGTEINLFNYTTDRITNTDYLNLRESTVQPSYFVNSTGYFGIRVYGNTTSASAITLYTITGNGQASYFDVPIRLRHSQLREWDEDSNYQHILLSIKNKLYNLFNGTGDDITVNNLKFNNQTFCGCQSQCFNGTGIIFNATLC